MAESLTLTYRSQVPQVAEYWLRIEPVARDLSVAADPAAGLIDAIYQLDPCYPDQLAREMDPADNAGLVGALAEDVFDTSLCTLSADRTAAVRVYRSHPEEEYTLRVSGAEAGEAIVTLESVKQLLSVNNVSSLELDKPVMGGFSSAWRGTVRSQAGPIAPPTVKRLGSLLYWDGQNSGVLEVSYRSLYDLVVLTFPVTDDGSEPPDAELLAFYHGTATLATVGADPLEDLTGDERYTACSGDSGSSSSFEELPGNCYEEVRYMRVCRCSGSKDYSHTVERQIACPEWIEGDGRYIISRRDVNFYADCNERDDCNSAALYQELCCESVPKTISLPVCCEVTTTFDGVGVGKDVQRQLEQRYPAPKYALSIIPVGPPPGEPCGKTVIKQRKGGTNCCEGVEPLSPPESDYVVGDNASLLISVEGGKDGGPFIWSTTSAGVYLDERRAMKSGETVGPAVRIFTADVCGILTVSVSDGCTSTTITIRAENGRWVEISGAPCLASGLADSEVTSSWSVTRTKISGRYKQVELVQSTAIGSCHPYHYTPAGLIACMQSELADYLAVNPSVSDQICIGGTELTYQCAMASQCTPPSLWPDGWGDPQEPWCGYFCWPARDGLETLYMGSGVYRTRADLVKWRQYYEWVC